MKAITIIVTLLVVAVTIGCFSPFHSVYCSDETVTLASTPIGTFNNVAFEQQCEATIVQGDEYALEIIISENIRDHLDIDKDGSHVRFSLHRNYTYQNLTFRVRITMPELSEVEASGASSVSISGFDSEHEFSLDLSGASRCDGDIICGNAEINNSGASRTSLSIDCDALEIDFSGASGMECNGNAGNISCDVSGASTLNMKNLQCKNSVVDLSGASSMSIRPTGTIRGELSGASKLYCYGTPTIGRFDVSGGSDIFEAD